MPQVQYIGTCNKQDSIRGVGLHWEIGQVRNVTSEVSERLLHFRDTWAKIETEDEDSEPIGLTPEDKPTEEPLPVIDFHVMDKKALIDFAETKYNERLDKRLSEASLRHKVIALFGQHELENEGK